MSAPIMAEARCKAREAPRVCRKGSGKPMHGKAPEDTSGKAVVDAEAFARNLARLMEESGRALAAYMKPREEGVIQDEVAEELADVTKTLGKVAEYWLSDPQRALEAQSGLVNGPLDLERGDEA